MKLTRLEIQSLPGIQPGFVLDDIATGTNLVVAPNAVGKSSLLRALRHLLDEPRPGDPAALSLAADFTAADGRYTVRRAGRDIQWLRDGRPAERPQLPAADRLHCYWLMLEDLLSAEPGQDERLVIELRRALGGGYDLDALAHLDGVQLGARHARREADSLNQAIRKRQEVEARYHVLTEDAARMPDLERRIDAAVRAEQRIRLLERALALADARRRHREIIAAAAGFPPDMDCLTGQELDQLAELDARRRACQAELLRQQGVEAAALARLEATGLSSRLPDAEQAAVARRKLEHARRLDQQRSAEQRRLTEADAALAEARAGLGGEASPGTPSSTRAETPTALSPDAIARAEALARKLQSAEAEADALHRRVDDSGQDAQAIEAELGRHYKATEALQAWLATRTPRVRRQGIALLVAGLAAAGTAGLAVLAKAWPTLAIAAIALAGILSAALLRRTGDAKERFSTSGLPAPGTWTAAEVRTRLQQLDAQIAELQLATRRLHEADACRERLQALTITLDTLHRERDALAREVGFDPRLTAMGLDRFVRLQDAQDRARAARGVAHSALERLQGEIAQHTTRVRAWLGQWTDPASLTDDLDTLEVGLDALLEQRELAVTAERDQQLAADERQRLERELDAMNEAEHALYRRTGALPDQPDPRTALAARLERLDAWRAHRNDRHAAETMEREARAGLADHPDLLAGAEADEPASLELELERARSEADELENLREMRSTLRERLHGAGRDLALEQAMAAEAMERNRLEERYDQARFATAASLLIDDVSTTYRATHEPEVLRDARARFRRFTHHAFDLELDSQAGFLARDLRQQALRPLAELSSGTRMQLLLAVRIAWARQIEQGGLALPLFLDEALTTSDEDRFGEVARSLEQLVEEEGRQVFYLSARKHEARLWAHATGRSPKLIDLGEIRFGRTTAEREDYVLPVERTVPSPDGRSAEEYAALLGVPKLDPSLPVADIHLFHLLRDRLELLHDLMAQWRISRLGPLTTLLTGPAAAKAIPDAIQRERLEERCRVVEAWWEAWQVGRGAPVSRGDLEASECVSETFIERVAERAALGGGDAATLISDLREGGVSRFRADAVNALEAWLERAGHLDPRTPLTAEARRTTALAAARTPADARATVDWLEAGSDD